MTELKPWDDPLPRGRREYEREHWGNGLAPHWSELPASDQQVWADRAPRNQGFRVTCEDLDTGEVQTLMLPVNRYLIITTGCLYLAGEERHKNGTSIITIKKEPA